MTNRLSRTPTRATAVLSGALALSVALAISCASSEPPADPAPVTSEAAPTDPSAPAPKATDSGSPASSGDPFAAQPDESEGLTNVSADLDAILEHGALAGACDRYRAGQTDHKTLVTCGKWMFFYETFGTAGVPAAIVKFLTSKFPDELGLGFSKLGMIEDPSSADHLPLGLAPTAPMSGNIEAMAFTCASCHFAQLPDKRYAVGAPNHEYDYGRHILDITLAPTLGLGMGNAADHHPDAVAKVQPVLDKLSGSLTLKGQFGLALLPLASVKQPGLTKEIEGQYASWPKGTLDFVIAPLPVDDHAHVVGKMMALWGLPRAQEIASSGMSNALLAWAGSTPTLDEFLRGFALLGGVAAPSDAALRPLLEYLYSLRAPANPKPPAAAAVAAGAQLFKTKGCAACHDGPRGSGKRAYKFSEVGTDPALGGWLDPGLTGDACCGIQIKPGQLTHGVKSPRMVGLWTFGRFLHNGALSSLEQLFCLEPRPAVGEAPLRTDGHSFTCDGLTTDEKKSLMAYVLAH